MQTKKSVTFRLLHRTTKDPETGKKVKKSTDVLIFLTVTYNGLRVGLSTNLYTDDGKWDVKKQQAIADNPVGLPAVVLNFGLFQLKALVDTIFQRYNQQDLVPTVEQLRADFEKERPQVLSNFAGIKEQVKSVVTPDNETAEPSSKTDKPKPAMPTESADIWTTLHLFQDVCGKEREWTEGTYEQFRCLKNRMERFEKMKRRRLKDKTFKLTFGYFDEKGLTEFMDFMVTKDKLLNSTLDKAIDFLKWFLRWSHNKRYNLTVDYQNFSPKLKMPDNQIIFMAEAELQRLADYEIPDDCPGLYRVRDVFLFSCYTGMRYSDVEHLCWSDVRHDYIQITTQKTYVPIRIELNDYSRAILEKYREFHFKGDKCLPVISNQKMNKQLKRLCKLAGFDEKIHQVFYRGKERIEKITPKYELISTHTGRRSFICNAIAKGISPQIIMKWTGHSDYKMLKPYIEVADKARKDAMKLFNDKKENNRK